MAPSHHIAFLLPDIGGGGAERLTIDLMGGMVRSGYRVDLLLQRFNGEFMHLVPKEVRMIDLAAPRIREAFGPLKRYLAEEQPDTLFAAMWPFTVIALVARLIAGTNTKVVVVDHCSLPAQYSDAPLTFASLRATILATYRHAHRIVGVSSGVSDELARLAKVKRSAVTVIHNPVPLPLASPGRRDALWQGRPGARILTIGRLKAQKNHALLIEAFARLSAGHEAVLAIVGVGELAGDLEAQVNRLGLTDQVLMPGFSPTPGDWYESADLFVLASNFEGFGNVLVEAMHCGLPVVATNCPHGPAEVLGYGKWGRLVAPGDVEGLSKAMAAALAEPVDVEKQRARAAEFSVERAVAAYADLVV